MNDFIELHERSSGKPIIVRVKAIDCVHESDTMYSYPVTLLTIGEKECEVVESYDEIRNMILGQPVIKWKYSDEDKELVDKWIEKLNSIGCQSFKITSDPYQLNGAYTEEDFIGI